MAKSDTDVIANGRDAMAWTEDFMSMCPGADNLDKMDVFAWFANAIETQHSIKLSDIQTESSD